MSDFGAVSRSRPTGQANLRCPDASRIDRGEDDWHERCFCGADLDEGTVAWAHGICRACWSDINGQFGVGA